MSFVVCLSGSTWEMVEFIGLKQRGTSCYAHSLTTLQNETFLNINFNLKQAGEYSILPDRRCFPSYPIKQKVSTRSYYLSGENELHFVHDSTPYLIGLMLILISLYNFQKQNRFYVNMMSYGKTFQATFLCLEDFQG